MGLTRRKSDASFCDYLQEERLRRQGGKWYFAVREGGPKGPYNSESEAKSALCLYIRHHQTLQKIDEFNSSAAGEK